MLKHLAIEAVGQRLKVSAEQTFRRVDHTLFSDRAAIVWFGAAICLSATLIFSVQPLFAKMALPRLGGSPNVWTTAMLFFQTLLLAGYAYAHWLSHRFTPGRQVAIHTGVVLLGFAFLPFAAPTDWAPSSTGVTFQLLWLLLISVGAPFFALSANAPLLQSWYGATRGRGSDDPYFLYAASNIGSFGALLAFPLLLEPFLSTSTMSSIWLVGYVIFGVTLAVCMLYLLRSAVETQVDLQTATEVREEDAETPLNWTQIAGWIALAAVPSSVMLGATLKISTDVGSFPFVWLAPLALYLGTFVISFSRWGPRFTDKIERVHVAFLAIIVFLVTSGLSKGAGFGIMAIYLAGMFFAALAFHTALVARRPGRAGLTAFYLSMSAGGAVGGLFNSLLAPAIFNGVYEYPLALALSALVVAKGAKSWRQDLLAIAPGLAPMALLAGAAVFGLLTVSTTPNYVWWLAAFAAALFMVRNGDSRRRLAILAGATLVLAHVAQDDERVVERDRSFFGAYSIVRNVDHGTHALVHGTTNHGAQRIEDLNIGPERKPEPLTYYYRGGPFSQVIAAAQARGDENFGVVGLGAGALACYAKPHENWVYFEIDPLVVEMAQNTKFFSFLSDCTPNAPMRVGDARIELEVDRQINAKGFDVLIVDAFSSDAIPLHLLTQEAMDLYADRLLEGGLIAIHLSNRYYDLEQPVAAAAQAAGLVSAYQNHEPKTGLPSSVNSPSVMIVLAKESATLTPFLERDDWRPAKVGDGAVWSDERASVLPYLK
ncbi:MAG: fused MFS/spermidine synthase [Neomegalonema sp.]